MNIVIIGAGTIGTHIAATLSREGNNVVLVDRDVLKLQQAARLMDVATRTGSGTDWVLLEELRETFSDLLLAVTNDDENNLVCGRIAKSLGYAQVVVRVNNEAYLNTERLDMTDLFHADHLICPPLLVAQDLHKCVMSISMGVASMEGFAEGSIQMRKIVIPSTWNKGHVPLMELALPLDTRLGLIYRAAAQDSKIIIPHGHHTLLPGDEVMFVGETGKMFGLNKHFALSQKNIDSVAIIGGTVASIYLAKMLQAQGTQVRLIEKDYERCLLLAEWLPDCTILNYDGTDIDFLQRERIGNVDVCVACTEKDELNLLAAMAAKRVGCHNIVVAIANTAYYPMLQELGIHYASSASLCVGASTLAFAREKTVTSLASLYDGQVTIAEVRVSGHSKITGVPISALGPKLPPNFLFMLIKSRGKVMVAHGNRVISPGDTVIVITTPRHLEEMEAYF